MTTTLHLRRLEKVRQVQAHAQVNVAFADNGDSEWLVGGLRAAATGDPNRFPGENRTVEL